ncbi:MAG TPA: CAP domain-containing protein, partial [Candidatus Pacearchaeota archaeon]|nr:CAP domain-containing protein [Candidatus Pacearchaeota archaeon]
VKYLIMANLKKIFLIVFLILIIGGSCWWIFYSFQEFIAKQNKLVLREEPVSNQIPEIPKVPEALSEPEKEAHFPEPSLKIFQRQKETQALDKNLILSWTNFYRQNEGVAPLKENEILNEAANQRLEDMFQKQYFAHVSPDGESASEVVEDLGYQYLRVGENLALGNFKDEKELVDAWMASPGHRENILNSKFKEIGIAVKRGTFEDEETFLAVQIFAAPLSDCPIPDENLKLSISTKEKELQNLKNEIDYLKNEIETLQKEEETLYNQEKDLLSIGKEDEIKNINDQLQEINREIQNKTDTYNQLVLKINNFSQELQDLISTYNQQVNKFNQCLQM